MEDNMDSLGKEEDKKENVIIPWKEEMAPDDFISSTPPYEVGKYFTYYEKDVMPCETVGDMTYYLYDPIKHGGDPSKQYPLLVFFHGSSNALVGEVCINYCGGEYYASEKYQKSMGGAYILIPLANEKQTEDGKIEGGWAEEYLKPCMELINQVKAKANGNISKTILLGNSSGGHFIWKMLLHDPDQFDGFIPMGAGYAPDKEDIELLSKKHVNLLLMHGKRDELAPFEEFLAPVEENLQKMDHCICYFPDWVRNADGGVASINFGFEMGQHCIVNAVQSNLMFDNGKCYDERLPEGVTGWIRSIL